MAIVIVPIAEAIGEGIAALWGLIAANAAPAAIATGVVGTGVVVANAVHDNSASSTNTTTVVGSGKMNCGEDGKYGDMLKKSGDNKFDRDHIPSKAALQEAARQILEDNPSLDSKMNPARLSALFGDKGLISKAGEVIAIPKSDHQAHSPTNGSNRNTPKQIETDSKELQKAAEKDTKAMEEAEGKEMDAECFEKYKKAAEKIRKKTHAEYIKELTELIKDVIKKY